MVRAAMDVLAACIDRIRASFPALSLDSVHHNPDGLANDVVIVNDELVFRFPKDQAARAALMRETKVLDLVRRYVSTPTPYFERHDADFVMYRLIRGEPLHRHTLLKQDERIQEALAEQLAVFLVQLHAIPRDEAARALGEPVERGADYWLKRYQDVERYLYPLLWADQRHWIDELFASVLGGSLNMAHVVPALIHDDLASYHILYAQDEQRISGVIDFGAARLGDPAADFALIISTYGESFLKRMSRYNPAIGDALDRARFLAGALELFWAVEGVRASDPSWLLVHIGRARDALPLGVRW
jgi:aminoglycoside 2''-phosphotransferase